MSDSFFSASYAEARQRFLSAAENAGAEILSYPVGSQADLSIDVAIIAPASSVVDGRAVMVTSGIHGVEGFFGSAVQLALLNSIAASADKPAYRLVLVHAINPYGFSHLRRFNESNIDLNRNFPGPENSYSGAPDGYALHNEFLNPCSPPSPRELFKLKAIWKIGRYGLPSLKESIATGQYEYPRGLFYGGHKAAQSTGIVVDNLSRWLQHSSRVAHVDLHTGLGKYAEYKLLLNEGPGSEQYRWYQDAFGDAVIESLNSTDGTAYPVRGVFGEWAQRQFGRECYRMIGAEFGTFDLVRVLSALRTENRAYHFCEVDSVLYKKAKSELLECFCPADSQWRKQVVESGQNIVKRAASIL